MYTDPDDRMAEGIEAPPRQSEPSTEWFKLLIKGDWGSAIRTGGSAFRTYCGPEMLLTRRSWTKKGSMLGRSFYELQRKHGVSDPNPCCTGTESIRAMVRLVDEFHAAGAAATTTLTDSNGRPANE